MSSKKLIIYNFSILFDILNEIKENFKFEIININKEKFKELEFAEIENYVIISQFGNETENCNVLNYPAKINNIIEQINVLFLGNKFSNQSNINVGNYILNVNSRKISKDKKELNLTEKEIELILFIKSNTCVSIKELQTKVWKHTSELETHTVETHIYRLRKKFVDFFDDNHFIEHNKKGYYLS